MLRRDMIRTSLALGAGASFSMPRLSRAQATSRTLRFVPQADAAILDPTVTTGLVNRNHGFLIFDTPYGIDEEGKTQPQMLEGHLIEDDGKLVTMRLREGLRFHDGEPVRGRDVVASLRRWAYRDAFGNSLMAVVNEVSAPDDRTIRWRLKSPFPMLPEALGKVGAIVAFIMPERLASADDPVAPVKELVGSGPFRFRADQHVSGSRLVYEKFTNYVPRASGSPSLLSGPKRAQFDRVEWQVMLTLAPPPQRCSKARSTGGTSRSTT